MTEKKKDTQKTATKAVKKTVAKKTEKPVRVMVSEDSLPENALPAINIAKIYNVSDFVFYEMKKRAGITDKTLLTMPEFRKQYEKVITKGR